MTHQIGGMPTVWPETQELNKEQLRAACRLNDWNIDWIKKIDSGMHNSLPSHLDIPKLCKHIKKNYILNPYEALG